MADFGRLSDEGFLLARSLDLSLDLSIEEEFPGINGALIEEEGSDGEEGFELLVEVTLMRDIEDAASGGEFLLFGFTLVAALSMTIPF